ncbi:hypothetical protein Bbelb_070930 [Branchiostoma belcheri]|nr:hypothetical protein Bbelb_070930 [Branchiostoma belcheri]
MVTVYVSYVRPLCEYACPVWGPGPTSTQTTQIENIQRRACRIILGKDYSRYSDACSLLGLPSLQQRRQHLILKFGRGLMESPTFRQWLPPTRGETSVTNRKPVLGINVGTDWAGARQPEKGGVPGGDEKFDRLRRNDVFSCLPTETKDLLYSTLPATGYEKTEIVKQCRASENGGLTTEVPETLENRNRFDSRAGGRAFLGQTSSLGHERRADVHHWVATDRPIATISVGCRTV